MAGELVDVSVDVALRLAALADLALGGLGALYAAGASNGLDPGPLVAGGAGAAAGGAAATATGTAGGGPFSDPMRNARLPGPEDDVGDATSPNQQLELARDGAEHPGGRILDVSRQLQKWADALANAGDRDHGSDDVWTVSGTSRN